LIDPIWNAVEVFWDRTGDLGWGALLLGIAFHVVRLLAVSRAWQNIIAAAYPGKEVRWRSIVAAVFAGVGVNAIVPARGGDVVRIFLAKRSVDDSSYATITSSMLLLGVFDFLLAGSLVIWAGIAGLLPGLDRLGPSFDFGWAVDNPRRAIIGFLVVLAILAAVLLWFAEQIGDFKQHIAQGFTALRDFRFYLRRVALWQAIDWTCRLVAVFFFLSAFGLPATLHNALLVQVSAGLASLLPISPGGIGTEQAFLLYLFSGQVSSSALLAFSVGMRLTLMVVNAALGFAAIFLTLKTVDWRAHVAQSPP
jgi:glycosyltransferase 2 family protein